MSLVPISPFLGQGPDFNREAAEAVYGQLMKMDSDSATVYGRMLVGAIVQTDLIVHGDEIAETVAKALDARTEHVREQLVRTSIAKARAGEDNSAQLAALVEISKAGLFSRFFLSDKAKNQKRSSSTGRFEVMHEPVHIPDSVEQIPGQYATRMGVPILGDNMVEHKHDRQTGTDTVEPVKLTPRQVANFQHGYMQARRLLRPYSKLPEKTGLVTFHYDQGQPTWAEYHPDNIPVAASFKSGDNVATEKRGIDPRRKLTAVTLDVVPKTDAAGGIFASLNALGMPKLGSLAAGNTDGGVLDATRLESFERTWNRQDDNDQFVPSQKVFRRLGAGSELLENSLGNVAPPQVKMALSVARHVGTVGPAAQRIVGPTMDRAAYRYRGTERKLDSRLKVAIDEARSTAIKQGGADAKLRQAAQEQRLQAKAKMDVAQRQHDRDNSRVRSDWDQAQRDLQNRVISRKDYGKKEKAYRKQLERNTLQLAEARRAHAGSVDGAKLREDKGAVMLRRAQTDVMYRGVKLKDGTWTAGPVINYMASRVPSPELSELQLKSGVVPPSEGIIIGGDGKVKHQTIGYGDDHFLPFTLRNLASLRGGYYVRTRTFGGPTSEDVYTALVSGARGLTVVSNSGVYTVEFDHDFKGGRRFNDKAARMVARYGSLLDAVKSKKVSGSDIDPAKRRELYQRAAREMPGNPGGQERRVEQLIAEERYNPTLSQAQIDAASKDYLNRELERRGMHDGKDLSLDDMARFLANKHGVDYKREVPAIPAHELQRIVDAQHAKLMQSPSELPRQLAKTLGVETGLEQALDKARTEYRRSLLPMQLDAHGYYAALQALKQQFPYYIADVDHQKLMDSDTGSVDGGYVKPKFNRPEGALAGHFDPTIGGTGKVRGDTVRWQNNMAIRPVSVRDADDVAQAGEDAGSDFGPSTRTVGGRGGPGAPAAGNQANSELQAQVDEEMLDHLLELADEPLGEKFAVEGARAAKLTEFSPDQLPTPGLKVIYGRDDPIDVISDYEDDPAAMRKHMEDAITWMQGNRAFHGVLDRDLISRWRAGGKEAPLVRLGGDNVMAALDEPDRDFDFRDVTPVFNKNSTATPTEVADLYRAVPAIEPLVDAKELPADVGDDKFPDAADTLARRIKEDLITYKRWERTGQGYPEPPFTPDQLQMRAYGVVQARQLRRRFKDAVNNELEVQRQGEQLAQRERDEAARAQRGNAPSNMWVFADEKMAEELRGQAGAAIQNAAPGQVIDPLASIVGNQDPLERMRRPGQ